MSFIDIPLPFLKKGMTEEPVKDLQKLLNSHLGSSLSPKLVVDGVFGAKTEAAVKFFQRHVNLKHTGIVTPVLWRSLGVKPPISLLSERTIRAALGGPGENLTTFTIPQLKGMNVGGGGTTSGKVTANAQIENIWKAVFEDLGKLDLLGYIVTFDGLYNKRKMKNSSSWSRHSWGLAIDLNAAFNPYRAEPAAPWQNGSLVPLVTTFYNHGFSWGGWWSNSDGMHFEIATLP